MIAYRPGRRGTFELADLSAFAMLAVKSQNQWMTEERL
jgi:hypothetical protein